MLYFILKFGKKITIDRKILEYSLVYELFLLHANEKKTNVWSTNKLSSELQFI